MQRIRWYKLCEVEEFTSLFIPGMARKDKTALLMIGSNQIRRVYTRNCLTFIWIRETVAVTKQRRQLPCALPQRMHPTSFVPLFRDAPRQPYCA